MKKIILVLMLVFSILFLTSCDREIGFVDPNNRFTNAYVKIGEDWVDVEIKAWGDYQGDQTKLTLKDGTVLVVHSVNCILYKGELPKEQENE